MDPAWRKLVKVGPDGRLLHEVVVTGVESISSAQPGDVVVDPRGSVLVLDRASSSIQAFDKNGALVATRSIGADLTEEARDPRASLRLDPFGRLWLLAPRERDLVRLGSSLERDRPGRFLTPEDSAGAPADAVTAADGTVWVADASSGVLRRFRASGALIGVVPAPDSSAVAYTTLASDPSGFVAAGDAAGQRVRVFAPDGTLVFERVLGSPRAPWRPTSIAWSARDRIAVVDGARGEVVILEVGRAAATGSGTTGEGKP